jgi:hypothetical protein
MLGNSGKMEKIPFAVELVLAVKLVHHDFEFLVFGVNHFDHGWVLADEGF